MKKLYTTFGAIMLAIPVLFGQQTFTTFENASMVIGQPNFQSQIVNTSDSITNGPAYCAISSQGMLAVAEQSGTSVKVWHSLPTQNGQASDVQISLPYGANGIYWSPDGNKLIVAGGSNNIQVWNSIPTVNNQPADVTINLYTDYPQGVLVTPGGRLLIAERYTNRILVWNSIPTTDDTPADYVIGQPDMLTTSSGNSSGKLNQPWGLALSPDGRLLIADEANNRVVVYDSVPTQSGDTATVVIGQAAFNISGGGLAADRVSVPVGVTVTIDGKVAVSEFGNNRVTIWDSVPVTNGETATVVLGQPDFTTSTSFNPGGTADTNNMSRPYNISSDLNGRLFLCGRDMNRVMVFGTLPSEQADLNITLNSSSSLLCDSTNVVFNVTINNLGPDVAYDVTATTALPSGFSPVSINADAGIYTEASGYWELDSIQSGDTLNLEFVGVVDTGLIGDTITMYANIINSSAQDTNLSNNGTSGSVVVTAGSKPSEPIVTGDTVCSGQAASLMASSADSIFWFSSNSSSTIIFKGTNYNTTPLSSTTSFFVEANNGCPSNRLEVIATVNPSPSVNLGSDTIFCSSFNLDAGSGASSYSWTTGATTQSITVSDPGIYGVTVTTSTGCTQSDQISLSSSCSEGEQTFQNFQNADLVIGQPDFQSQINEISDSILSAPTYSAISSQGMLAVAEQYDGTFNAMGCVKIWYKAPKNLGEKPDVIVGSPNFSTHANGPNDSLLSYVDGVAWSPDGNKLIAASGDQNRVLIWNSIPSQNGQPADVVIGQTDFVSTTSGVSDSTFSYPNGLLVTPNGKLLVSDWNNNRILIFNSIPTQNGAHANVVIGQPNFNTGTAGTGLNNLNTAWGTGITPTGELLVADEGNHRILIFDSIPVSNGEAATRQLGITGLAAATDSTFFYPIGVTGLPDGRIAVGEFGNNRITIFDALPSAPGEVIRASAVLGQPDFESNLPFAGGVADTNNLSEVYNVCSDLNGRLFAAGRNMHRVMVYGILPDQFADLGIDISSSSDALCDSTNIIFIISITNDGPDAAYNISATTALPSGFSPISVTVNDGVYNDASGYWDLDSLQSGMTATIEIVGIVDSGMIGQTLTTYGNIVNSSAQDTNLTNNGTSSSVLVTAGTKPNDPVVQGDTVCYGETATLTASATDSIFWYETGASSTRIGTGGTFTTGSIDSTSQTTYYVETNNGCPSNRVKVELVGNANPEFALGNDTTLCGDLIVDAGITGVSYSWSSGGTNQTITVSEDGTYGLTVTNPEGCTAYDEIIVDIFCEGLSEFDLANLKVYPNPSKGKLIIESVIEVENIVVRNINGQILISEHGISSKKTMLDLGGFENGMYFIEIQLGGSDEKLRGRVIKTR